MTTGKWKKNFSSVSVKRRDTENTRYMSRGRNGDSGSSVPDNNSSWLPELYYGSPDRVNRYKQYDYMDYDVDVNMALDKTAEFCTLLDETTKLPFILDIGKDLTTADSKLLHVALEKWCRLNDWNGRIFDVVRSTLKYGDQIFIRDPDTYALNWVDMYNVRSVLVNEEEGKTPEYYFIKNLELNLQERVISTKDGLLANINMAGLGGQGIRTHQPTFTFGDSAYGQKWNDMSENQEETPVDAAHVVHISRSQGMDHTWPFGSSILDPVFKPFRQKELMEEAIIIYRVQRSPERLVFKIDTGDMNAKKSKEYLEEVKKEFKQKRVPIVDRGNGQTIMDTTFSPLSMTEDFFFAQGMDGRGSSIETLAGGECFSMDTEIQLYDGSVDTLENIITRYRKGEQLWIYSIDPVTEVVIPAMVSWAGITREDTEVILLEFTDGTSVKVTPDHKFPIKGIGYVEAKDIQPHHELLFVDFKHESGQNKYFNKQTNTWDEIKNTFDTFFEGNSFVIDYERVYGREPVTPFVDTNQRTSVRVARTMVLPNLDTGTITVDGAHHYTDNHTFALANGVFTKNSTGSIEDLKFFSTRLVRALRVPVSYMSYLTEDGNGYVYNDGKQGAAYMEEFSYSEYCKRLQRQLIKPLNREFKLYVKSIGIEISASEFDITLTPPQSFSEYRQIELDTAQMNVFQAVADVPYLSNRFKLKRFMGLSEAEMKENEALWREEKKINFKIQDSTLSDAGYTVPSDNEVDELEMDEEDIMSADDDKDEGSFSDALGLGDDE